MSNSGPHISDPSTKGRRRLGRPLASRTLEIAPAKPAAISDAMPPLIRTEGLTKSYFKSDLEIPVLRGVDVEIAAQQFTAIVGQSGSGKSTLLHLLAALDAPDKGKIFYEGNRIDDLPAKGRDVLRNQHFGMIFQSYHLLPELSTLENVMLPQMISSSIRSYLGSRAKLAKKAAEVLETVGLSHRLKHLPRELSGGEMQRVAIARALVSEPQILFADEPTGNLDSATGSSIMELLRKLNRDRGLTIALVTHDESVARQAHRTVRITDGRAEPTVC